MLVMAMTVAAAALSHRGRVLNALWVLATIDMAAMTYLSLPMADRNAGVTYAAVAYLCAGALFWLLNPLRRSGSPRAGTSTRRLAAVVADPGEQSAEAQRRLDKAAATPREEAALASDVTPGVRVTLAVMAVSMAYMLTAMQFTHMTGPMMR